MSLPPPPLTLVLEFARAEQTQDPYGFQFAAQDYLLRTSGGGFERATLAWSETLLGELAAVRLPHCDPVLRQRLGETLRQFLVPLGWAELSAQILEANRRGQRVLLSIRSAAAELYALPWELVTLKSSGQHIGELAGVLLRYEWPETATTVEQPLPRSGCGRILVAWSAAGGAVPAGEHVRAIAAACRTGLVEFDPARDVLEHATASRLTAALSMAKRTTRPISVLHLLCHGGATGSTFGLLLSDDAQPSAAVGVDAARLRQLLAPYADMVRLVVLMACDSGNTGRPGNQLGSIAQTLHRAGIAAVVASRHPLSVPGSVRLTESLYKGLLCTPDSLESALLAARERLAQDATGQDWASVQLYARAADGDDSRPILFRPYQGLSSFQEEHSRFFFGRRALTERLWQRCLDLYSAPSKLRLLAILGPSGSGKSSVARAGLVPELVRRPLPDWPSLQVAMLRPGEHPMKELQRALAARSEPSPSTPFLVLIDQFEEVYTLCSDAKERDEFVSWLLRAASDRDQRIGVLLTLRSDFYGETQRHHAELNQLIAAQHELVPGLTGEELAEIIAEPARACGRPIDPDTVELLLTQARGNQGALPLLEFALTRIWEGVLANREPGATLRELGGMGGALAAQARKLYQALDPREQATARRALLRLVRLGEGTRDTRRRARVSELCGRNETEADVLGVLRKFAAEDARIVTLSSRGAEMLAEVTHEALFEYWTELREWIEKGREDRRFHDRVAEAAKLWDEERSGAGRLWRPPDLDLLREFRARRPEDLSPLDEAFFDAAEKAHQAELDEKRQSARRLRLGLVLLSVFLAAAIGLAVLAVKARQLADLESSKARRERDTAVQRELDMVVEDGRQLLVERDRAVDALLRLHRAKDRDSRSALLPFLLREAARPLDAVQLVLNVADARSASYSPDGSRIVVTNNSDSVKIFDAKSGEPVLTFKAGEMICSAEYSPDGRRIVTASEDSVTRVFDAQSGHRLLTLPDSESGSCSASYSPDGRSIVSAGLGYSAAVFDANTGEHRVISPHSGKLTGASYSPDSRRIVLTGLNSYAQVLDARSGRMLVVLKGHSDDVASARFSPDGNRVVTASKDAARIFDSYTGELLIKIQGSAAPTDVADYSPDGERILTAGRDGTTRVYDARNGQLLDSFKNSPSPITSASYSPDGSRILTAGQNGQVRVYDPHGGPLHTTVSGHRADVHSAAFSPDGSHVVTASDDKTANLYDVRSGQLLATLTGHTAGVKSAAFSPDGSRIVTASDDKTARIFDVRRGQPIATLTGHTAGVKSAAFSPDGSRIVTASQDRTAVIHDARSGQLLLRLSGHRSEVTGASFSPDSSRVVTASLDGDTRIYDARSGLLLRTLSQRTDRVMSASFSPDGTSILTANADTTARVHSAVSGELLLTLSGHAQELSSASYSPDGRRIVTASEDHTVRVWDAQRGRLLATLSGHAGRVHGARFNHDGSRIVSASADRKAMLWDAAPEMRSTAELQLLIACRAEKAMPLDAILQAPIDPRACGLLSPLSQRPYTREQLYSPILAGSYSLRAGQLAAAEQSLVEARRRLASVPDPRYLALLSLAEAARTTSETATPPASVVSLIRELGSAEQPRAWLSLAAFAADVLHRPSWALWALGELEKVLPEDAPFRANARAKALEVHLLVGHPDDVLRQARAVFVQQIEGRDRAVVAALAWAAAWQKGARAEKLLWADEALSNFPQPTDFREAAPFEDWTFDGLRHFVWMQPESPDRTAALALFLGLTRERRIEDVPDLAKLLNVPVPDGIAQSLRSAEDEDDVR